MKNWLNKYLKINFIVFFLSIFLIKNINWFAWFIFLFGIMFNFIKNKHKIVKLINNLIKSTDNNIIFTALSFIFLIINILFLTDLYVLNFIESLPLFRTHYRPMIFLSYFYLLIYVFFYRKKFLLKKPKKILFKQKKQIIFLVIITLFLFSTNFLTIKFIDSDEIRLLYDAKLINIGKKPFIDFDTRAPFIIYFLSVFNIFFKNNLNLYYLIPITINLGSSILIYLVSKKIFKNKLIPFLTTFTFITIPIIINFLYIKTQTFQVFFILLSTFLLLTFREKKKIKYFIFFLLALAAAFFSRPSTIFYYPIFIFIINDYHFANLKKEKIIQNILLLIFLLSLFYLKEKYFTYTNNSLLNQSKINITITEIIQKILEIKKIFSQIIFYISPFYILTFFIGLQQLIIKYINSKKNKNILLPILGLVILSTVYLYNTIRKEFYPQYLMEFIPYFSMINAFGLLFLINNLNKKALLFVFVLLVASNTKSYVYLKKQMGYMNKEVVEKISKEIPKYCQEIFTPNPAYAFISDINQIMDLSHSYYSIHHIKNINRYLNNNPQTCVIYDNAFQEKFSKDNALNKNIKNNYQEIFYLEKTEFNKNYNSSLMLKIKN